VVTAATNRKFKIGDRVTIPFDDGCCCNPPLWETVADVIRNVDDGNQSALFGDRPGPFYAVRYDHVCRDGCHCYDNGAIYAEHELEPA
jgi:hypothetical protein